MEIANDLRERIFRFSAIGAADQRLRENLDGKEIDWTDYERELKRYRLSLALFNLTRILFYAGLINSVASTFNIWGASIIQQIASYIGVTVVLILYFTSRHLVSRREEIYRLEREVLLSKSH